MAETTYTYYESNFLNDKVEPATLRAEIQSSSITIALASIVTTNGQPEVYITFKADLSTGEKATLDSLVASHTGEASPTEQFDENGAMIVNLSSPKNIDGAPRFEPLPRTGNKVQLYSVDFADKTTWYYTAERKESIALNHVTGNQYQIPEQDYIVDSNHGHIVFEHRFQDEYALNVYDSGSLLVESDPDGQTHDYVCDYSTGLVTLENTPSGTITADYSLVKDSIFKLVPDPGKKLVLMGAELQFALDVSLRDTLNFELRGGAGLDPRIQGTDLGNGFFQVLDGPLVPVGYPIPMTTNRYKTVLDIIAESNMSYPLIKKTSNPNPTWRDLQEDLQIFKWDYASQAVIEMRSSWGNEIQVWFEKDVPAEGWAAIATFYAISESE